MAEQDNKYSWTEDIPRMVPCDVVGLSCRFPQSNSASEFWGNLSNGVDMVTADDIKWSRKTFSEVPARFGKLKEGEYQSFDASFFQVHGKQAQRMEPQLYKLLEVTWEAWNDSGIDVRKLRGSDRVGVYCGAVGSEIHGGWLSSVNEITGYEQTGCVMNMLAGRLSFFYSFRGPSKYVDTACSSSAIAMHDAMADITANRVDYALVVGASCINAVTTSLAFHRLHMLSPEGACKAFDAAGNGYCRAEGVAAVILVRNGLEGVPKFASIPPYTTILNAGTNNDGWTKEGITFPNQAAQLALEQRVCKTAKVDPATIVYIEAHGTGTVAGDGQELAAVDKWYGRAEGRQYPVMIGSVKSNMGHCEGASGLAGLIKVCLSYETGTLPQNLHYHRETPNPTSEGLRDGTLKVVDELTPWEGGNVALSSFGFSGSNVHMVMSAPSKRRQKMISAASKADSDPNRIIPLAARTSEGLATLSKALIEAEEESGKDLSAPLRRYANACAADLRLNHRGTIINGELKAGQARTVAPQVWFAFSGNGSQWSKMGASLLESNAVFRRSVEACAAALAPHKLDLMAEFQKETGFKTPLLAAVGLIAIQIGLVDVLKESYGITPEGMLGHSAGEIACAYASGCCTREQATLIAYHRGRLPVEHGVKNGLMAATGLSAEEAIARVEGTNVVLACDNSPVSTTLSGPAADVQELVKALDEEGVFARALDTNGVPYHSPALDPLLAELDASLKEVISEPKKRPAGWISGAFPANSEHPEAGLCSAGYQVYSYRNQVLFTAAAKDIPNNAVIVEIGPHSILRSPLRQSRPDLSYVGAMRKGFCGLETLAATAGELWRKGVPVQWEAPPLPLTTSGAELPRSVREALASWDRSVYDLPKALTETRSRIFEKVYHLGGEHAFICDHVVDNMVFIPMACFLVTAWEAFAQLEGHTIWELPVEFTDVNVLQPVRADRDQDVALWVIINTSNRYEVLHGAELVMEGTIHRAPDHKNIQLPQLYPKPDLPCPDMKHLGCNVDEVDYIPGDEWYKEIARKNIVYGPYFQMVHRYAIDGAWSELLWKKNWIIHLDGYFQTNSRNHKLDQVKVAKGFRKMTILDTLVEQPEGSIERVDFDHYWGICKSPSVLIEGYNEDTAPLTKKPHKLRIGALKFMPYGHRLFDEAPRVEYMHQLKSLAAEVLKNAIAGLPETHQAKANAVLKQLAAEPLTEGQIESLASENGTGNHLARIFADVLKSDVSADKLQAAVLEHPVWKTAMKKDLLLDGFGKDEMGCGLALTVCNQSAVGYNVCEVGMSDLSFTRRAMKMFIGTPNSSLLRYTATSADLNAMPRDLQHDKLKYQEWDFNKNSTAESGPFNVIVAKHLAHKAHDLRTVAANLAENLQVGGFLVLTEITSALGAAVYGLGDTAWEYTDDRECGPCTSVAHWQKLLAEAGLTECCLQTDKDGNCASFLYRKLSAKPKRSFPLAGPAPNATPETMDAWIKAFLSTMEEAGPTDSDGIGSVWVYGDVKSSPGVLGFVHSARKEPMGDRVRGILKWSPLHPEEHLQLIEQCRKLDLVDNVIRDGRLGAYVPVRAQEYNKLLEEKDMESGCHMDVAVYGNLKSIIWRANPPLPELNDDLVPCTVAFGALNFRDVMLAYGKLSKNQMAHDSGGDNIGFEFSGVNQRTGKRVMGSAKNAIATKVVTRSDLVWEVPESWSLAEAATVPTAYMTAYYSLVMRGHLRKGMRVLIHSGTGAVGLAAVQICLSRGAEVFVTVGSAAKKQFLLDTFPQLREDHIGDSRSVSFEGLVRNISKGRGVHLLLNSLAGDKLQASVRCIGKGGKLLEIGKYDILKGTPLSMRPMLDNIGFEGIDVDRVMNDPDHAHELEEVNELVAAGLRSGEVKPLPVTIFGRNNAEDAFRYMAKGVHIGKCLLDMSAKPEKQSTAHCLGARNGNAQEASETPAPSPPLKLQPNFTCRPDRSYIITGGIGGFGLMLAEWLAEKGARHLVLTSKRGLRHGGQAAPLRKIFVKGVDFRVSKLDVAVPEEAQKIVDLAETMAPVGGIFHLAMTLTDKLLANQTGEGWTACMAPKALGAHNMDKVSRGLKTLDYFVMWSSFVASAGNEGQCNYGFANSCQDILAEERKAAGYPALSIQWGVIDGVGVADARIQGLMQGGLLGASLPQSIDDCLTVVGRMLSNGEANGSPVMSSCWQPMDVLKSASADGTKGLLEAVLGVMGVRAADVNETDTLANLGIDSMQLVEVRATLQRAMGRPVALEEVSAMTIGSIIALESPEGEGEAAPPAPAATPKKQPPTKAPNTPEPADQKPTIIADHTPHKKDPQHTVRAKLPEDKLGGRKNSVGDPDTPERTSEADASELARSWSIDA